MWEAVPLSKLGAWDGQCIWKMKDGSHRCRMTIGPETASGRIGNRDELLARIRRGETLTGQERIDLARGLCCLEWHSTEYIAQQICGMWARQPAPEVSLSMLESGVERLREGFYELARELEKSKATEKQCHDSWVATIPQIKGLEIEIEGLKKALDDSRNANEILEKELFTAQFGVARKTAVRRVKVRLPPINSETLFPTTPEEHVVSSKSGTPTNTQISGPPSFQDSGFFFSSTPPDPTFSAKKTYSAFPFTFSCVIRSHT